MFEKNFFHKENDFCKSYGIVEELVSVENTVFLALLTKILEHQNFFFLRQKRAKRVVLGKKKIKRLKKCKIIRIINAKQ